MGRRLSVSIRRDGTVVAEASGTPGPSCLDALQQLQDLLRASVVDSRPTPEFAMTEPVGLDLGLDDELPAERRQELGGEA